MTKSGKSPELIYGKRFEGGRVSISSIQRESGSLIIEGEVFSYERKDIKNNKALIIIGITDFADSFKIKLYVEQKKEPVIHERIKKGVCLRVKGSVVFDEFDKDLCMQKIVGIMTVPSILPIREDRADKKRVELHCHTNMSDMDGISSAGEIIEQAYKWGMTAIAITDHAVVQGLTEGYHFICDYKKKHRDSDIDRFKLILGMEGYLVDDINAASYGNMDSNSEKRTEITDKDVLKRLTSSHVVILVRNEVGRTNLYNLVSESHLRFFYRKPLIPKSELIRFRDGLIIGSACCAGELFKAVVNGAPDDEIAGIVDFYDYLEIQPIANNRFMLNDVNYPNVRTEADLRALNKDIVRLGEKYNKPVVGTCDVHFLNPADEIYREVILTARGMMEEPAPLYLRTTEEMLSEFSYLGVEKAREVVVENTNRIMELCENVPPVRPDKCPPVIENSDEILKKVCFERSKELYGNDLPKIVQKRLEKELNSIIGNGYSALYITGQKLVNKSLHEGYLVGSRGSVGSSFAAYTAGITEVNPLPPHYLCPSCKHSDFDSEEVRKNKGNCGCDMPDKKCPVCGSQMKKEGFGIPFEIFLGFEGDKEPDIDLNFSGKIQGIIQKYTEEIFGSGNCFKAGTVGTIAEKSAYGFVKKYLEEKGLSKRRAEIQRLAKGCEGVKRGTGQHPGGIVILPRGEDINSFTPVQYPANDSESPFITTHFDYHSIDHNLLKFDLLGHDDPTMLRFLKDYTEFDPKEIAFDDNKVMSLFKDTDVLGISPEQIGGTKVGCLGIPEFGTDFAMSMVVDAKPESISDLVRISGLSHGTDVWLGNAKDLIDSGTATLKSCICCRDDIMTFLIEKGMDKQLAFETMESVRKGKGLSEKMENAMKGLDIPGWYIDSCKKIKYMFPKAHAAAYVMMAWRIAFYKIYFPQDFYAAWFTIRAKALNYRKMFQGKDVLREHLIQYRFKTYLTQTEKDEYYALRVAEEMYARGIEIEHIELKKVNATDFCTGENTIMPSLISIPGLGEKAAEQIIEEARKEPFSSIEDFKYRTKCPQAVLDNMLEIGILKGLPNSSQLSIFDFLE